MKQTILFLLLACCLALSGAALPGAAQAQTPSPTRTPTPRTPRGSPGPVAPDEVTKTACAAAFGYADLDALKADVFLQAKRQAINELFGELISASTQVENFAVTSDQILALSAGFVRVRSDKYSHGPNLGDVCVTVIAYATAEDRAKFVPVRLNKRNCVTDANLSVGQIRALAQEEVLTQALVEYDRRLADTERESLLRLLRRVVYTESGFLTGTESYCVTAQGEVMPLEVIALVEGKEVLARYIPISIQDVANDEITGIFPNFPVGVTKFGDIVFDIPIENNKVSTQCEDTNVPEVRANWPQEVTIDTPDIKGAEAVYVVIGGGRIFDDTRNKPIGSIEFRFINGVSHVYDLIAGTNIRNWNYGGTGAIGDLSSDDALIFHTEINPTWGPAVMDLLSIDIPPALQANTLDAIIVRDTSTLYDGVTTCLFFSAITLRVRS